MIQNKNGLVPVVMLRPDGKYCPGDVAGFLPQHAERLCANGPAGQLPKARLLTQEEHDKLNGVEPKMTREMPVAEKAPKAAKRVVKKDAE